MNLEQSFEIGIRDEQNCFWPRYNRDHKGFDCRGDETLRGFHFQWVLRYCIDGGYREELISSSQVSEILAHWEDQWDRDQARKQWAYSRAARLTRFCCHVSADRTLFMHDRWEKYRNEEQYQLAYTEAL